MKAAVHAVRVLVDLFWNRARAEPVCRNAGPLLAALTTVTFSGSLASPNARPVLPGSSFCNLLNFHTVARDRRRAIMGLFDLRQKRQLSQIGFFVRELH
jgi:hypothetical protein